MKSTQICRQLVKIKKWTVSMKVNIEEIEKVTLLLLSKLKESRGNEIELNNETGEVSKTCGDPSKPGCNKGNTW